MSNESNLQVTFSNRRSRLFKKASELCTLSGAQVALMVFSPSEKVFSFGHPNVDDVIDRFLVQAAAPISYTIQLINAHRPINVCELNSRLTQINNQLNAKRKRGEELAHMKKVSQLHMWWAMPIDQMSLSQLDQYKVALEGLKNHVAILVIDKARLESARNLGIFHGPSSSSNLVNQPQPQSYMLENYMFADGPAGGGFF